MKLVSSTYPPPLRGIDCGQIYEPLDEQLSGSKVQIRVSGFSRWWVHSCTLQESLILRRDTCPPLPGF